jgi:hypothetical protein
VAILLNQTSNLRLRLELLARLSDGVLQPASLQIAAAVERYQHARPGRHAESGFAEVVTLAKATLLDLDLIDFLQALEALLERLDHPVEGAEPLHAALEPASEPSLALRIAAGPGVAQVEAGLDLRAVLEPIGGRRGEPGHDLALFRFFADPRPLASFCAQLIEEFQRFPTDPSKVAKGEPA